jgi:hypothetical protein
MTAKVDSSLRLDSVPMLEDVSNYHKWKLAIEDYLLVNGCLGIIEGTDIEPYRATSRPTIIDGEVLAIPIARTVRAGSAAPTGSETVDRLELDRDELGDWNDWRKRELRTCQNRNTHQLMQ